MSMKPGQTTLPRRVDDLGAGRRREAPAEPRDLAVLDQDVLDGVDAVRRVDHAAAPDQQEAHAPSPPLRPGEQEQDAHAHRDAVGHLVEDDGVRAVGDLGRELDAAVQRARDA